MRVVESFPHEVREIEHLWIPLPDGTRLAARMWLPKGAERRPVPAVVEYIPYGKREGTRDRDEPMHRWYAGHGYAALRIDLRGSGESDGLMLDEYLPQELEDGTDAISWIAAQPWCSGAVGLIGISWGGFNALQIAALRPPALRAIVTVCSTDDRYADDAHYMGGCLINDNLYWGALFFQLCAQPPDPALVGEGWRETWRRRLEVCEPHLARWMRHPLRDDYWRHGSVCEDWTRIQCPVYAVGGWTDGYSDAIPRLLAGMGAAGGTAVCKGLIGPWSHAYPHAASPGPAIGFLQETARWWDRWLHGNENGIDAEPAYRVWMQESVPAGSDAAERPGRWVAEQGWPSARIAARTLTLVPGRLLSDPPASPPTVLEIRSPQTLGAAAGGFFSTGLRDQREDDAGSLCFDSEPAGETTELLGAPELELTLAVDRPVAFVCARLCDVARDGSATRISYGVLNLTHDEFHTRSEPLVPGERRRVRLRMHDAAHALPPGHRLRLALSTSYWPLVWPSPEPVALSVWTHESRLAIPLRPPDAADAKLRPFEPPEAGPEPAHRQLSRGERERSVDTDPETGEIVTRFRSGFLPDGSVGRSIYDAVGISAGDAMEVCTRIHPQDPLRARVTLLQRTELERGTWSVAIETEVDLSCTPEHFVLRARLLAHETKPGGLHVEKRWDERIPRVGV